MLFNIPQFIDKEDKIVGPLTAKQLGWLACCGTILLVLWAILDKSAFIIASIPTVGIFGALAFYRPNNQPLIAFITSGLSFAFRPKIYVWQRVPEKKAAPRKIIKKTVPQNTGRKIVDEIKIKEVSGLLDQK